MDPFAVRIAGPVVTERSEQQSKWELQEGKDKSANDDRMFYAAFAAALIALLQGVFFAYLLVFMRRAMRQTEQALDHSRKELAASQRAWLKLEISFAQTNPEHPDLKSPLLIDQSGLYAWFKIKLKNYGNAPALSVLPVLRLHAPSAALPGPTSLQRHYCDQVKDPARHVQDMGAALFPGEEVEWLSRTNLRREDLDRSIAYYSPQFNLPIQVFQLYLVGCIDYKLAVDGSHHQTGFVFQIGATQAKNGTVALGGLMPAVSEPLPVEDLVLTAWTDSGAFFAD